MNGGVWQMINHHLVMRAREGKEGREASSSARVIDAQSLKTDENGGPRGCVAGSQFNTSFRAGKANNFSWRPPVIASLRFVG